MENQTPFLDAIAAQLAKTSHKILNKSCQEFENYRHLSAREQKTAAKLFLVSALKTAMVDAIRDMNQDVEQVLTEGGMFQ